jgi:hypothetical protein
LELLGRNFEARASLAEVLAGAPQQLATGIRAFADD